MMGEIGGSSLGLSAVQAMLDAQMPKPATSAPPPVMIDSVEGDATTYARADHTHESRLQARRIQVAPNAQGQYVYVFPKPYANGIVPIVNVTAETPAAVTYRNDASILQDSITPAQCTIVVTKLNSNVVTGLLNAVLPVLVPQTAATWVNIMSRAPS